MDIGVDSNMDIYRDLDLIAEEVRRCTRCPLHRGRLNAVPGEGSPKTSIMFIGEAPGRMEDIKGRPFVGRAGKLLTALLNSIGIKREEVFITNVVKCRPPDNRDPSEYEIGRCLPYLRRQIQVIKPKLIVALGRHSARTILAEAGRSFRGINRDRGSIKSINLYGVDTNLLITYHPAAALYNPSLRNYLEADFKKIRRFIEGGHPTLDDYL